MVLARTFEKHNPNKDYRLSRIVECCFAGPEAEEDARRLCRNIVQEINAYRAFMSDIERTVRSLAELQPVAFLDAFLGKAADGEVLTSLRYSAMHHAHPLLAVPMEARLKWAGRSPLGRFPRLAQALGMFPRGTASNTGDGDQLLPLAVTLIDHAPDKAAVLAAFEESLAPLVWTGPRSDVLEERRRRLEALASHPDATVRAWAVVTRHRLAECAERDRQVERTSDRRSQSFE